MKGILLTGGTGSRLAPLTKVTNKHLLPVGGKPMLYWPLETLREIGIQEVMVVVGGNSTGDILQLLGDGTQFGFKRLYYAFQSTPGGIAHALALTEEFVAGSSIAVILGDNIFTSSVQRVGESFLRQKKGARVLLTEVADPSAYGCPDIGIQHQIVSIEEKPKEPKSPYAVTGLYFYDSPVYNLIRQLKCSPRGEMEITDLNNLYAMYGDLHYDIYKGFWGDAGESIEALQRVSQGVMK